MSGNKKENSIKNWIQKELKDIQIHDILADPKLREAFRRAEPKHWDELTKDEQIVYAKEQAEAERELIREQRILGIKQVLQSIIAKCSEPATRLRTTAEELLEFVVKYESSPASVSSHEWNRFNEILLPRLELSLQDEEPTEIVRENDDAKKEIQDSLPSQPPITLQKIKWVHQNWRKYWVYILIALALLIISGIFVQIKVDLFNKIFNSQKKTIKAKLPDSYNLEIFSIGVSSRGPLWGHESFDDDEVVVKVSGQADFPDLKHTNVIVAFWRLANSYETNWHVGRRRDGGNYKLAMIEPGIVNAGTWDFFVGGIECKKTYEGDVALVLLLYPESIVKEQSYFWRRDSNGWGFRELPQGYLAASGMRVFRTTPNRK